MARKPYSKWRSRGIMALCIVLGLAAGFAGGYYLSRELKKRSEASRVKSGGDESKSSAPESSPGGATGEKSTAPESTTPPAVVTGSTPADAMEKYLEARGKSTSGMSYSVVSTSRSDLDWKIDKASSSGGTYYFVLHFDNGAWTVVDYGTGFNADRLAADGAPADLLTDDVPRVP